MIYIVTDPKQSMIFNPFQCIDPTIPLKYELVTNDGLSFDYVLFSFDSGKRLITIIGTDDNTHAGLH